MKRREALAAIGAAFLPFKRTRQCIRHSVSVDDNGVCDGELATEKHLGGFKVPAEFACMMMNEVRQIEMTVTFAP